MTCRELIEFLMAYLDDELEPRQRAVFDEHLGECSTCVDYLDTYQQTVELGKCICEEPEGPVPDEVPEGLVRAILAARKAVDR